MNNGKKKLNKLYLLSKEAKVGETVTCPSCSSLFVKINHQQAFCKTQGGTVCKDNFWNNVTPTKRNNTTRISPASAAYMAEHKREYFNDFDDDPSWDAHKDTM